MTPPAAAANPAVRPRRPLAPARPRRVSGPARPRPQGRPSRTRRSQSDAGLFFGLISSLEGLAQHRLIDRLIRGRIWIGLVAFALIGIVTLQLGLLRLNGGIGRAIEHEAMLQRENAALSIENSDMASAERVDSRAARLGMVGVPLSSLRFLDAHPGSDAAKAAAALSSSARSSRERSETEPSPGSATAGESSESQRSGSGESRASSESSATANSSPESSSGEHETPAAASGESSATSEAPSSGSEAIPAGGAQAGPPGG